MEKVLALYDSDYFYVTRFLEYMNRKKASDFKVSAFTRRESLEDYLRSRTIEILLIGEDMTAEELSYHNVRYIYHLSDNPHKAADNSSVQIFKYQSAKMLMKEIIEDYEEKESLTKTPDNAKRVKLISVFSPAAGAEKLSFAWSLGTLMSEQNKVLFVPLEPFPVPLLPNLNIGSQCLTDFIYYLKEDSNITRMKPLLTHSGKLYVLSGIVHGADVLSLSVEDIQRWTEELYSATDFQTVIFYLGCYSEAMVELMKLSDMILAVSLDSPYETAILGEWERQMKQSGAITAQEKIHYIRLQRQEVMNDYIPLTMQDLMNSEAWREAEQYLNT